MIGAVFDRDAYAAHDWPGHAENQRRLDHLALPAEWRRFPLRPAADDELRLVHAAAHIARVDAAAAAGGVMLDPDTYCTPATPDLARRVVGAVVDLALATWSGTCARGLALVRPPGHHATADQAMGFCLYNNVAVAAAALRAAGAARVAVLDFDVHHGNGTQDIFSGDPTVFFASSHQFPHYPGTGRADETGTGAGLGFTRNAPLDAGTGDAGFLAAWRDDLLPAARAFAPDMILVSAGFDAHAADPLAGLTVSTAGFDTLIGEILALADACCGGKVVFLLEGGYDPAALGDCVAALVARLDADSPRGQE